MPSWARGMGLLMLSVLAGCAAGRASLPVASPYADLDELREGQILHLPTGTLLSEEDLLNFLAPYPVVYVGETHDNVDAHTVQLKILRGIFERFPGEVALGLEMLTRDTQPMADAYILGKMDEETFVRLWTRTWGPTWGYYRDILHYARDYRIPVLALNAEEPLKRAVRTGETEGIEAEVDGGVPEMDLDDPYHRASSEAFYAGHHMGAADAEVFYRIQVLWDETMADTAARYLESPEGEGKHLLIFAGGQHVRYGFGIPRRLFRRVPLPYAIVGTVMVEIPENKRDRIMDVEPPELPLPPADVFYAVGYRDLEDLEHEE